MSNTRKRKSATSTTKALQPARDLNRTQRILVAQQMRIEGYEWEQIAETLGIKGGKGAAYNLVNNALIQALREGDKAMRELENQRLDALHRVYWPKALSGDGWSHDRVLRQMERRAALNGLDTKNEQPQMGAQVYIRAYPSQWTTLVPSSDAPTPAPAIASGEGTAVS